MAPRRRPRRWGEGLNIWLFALPALLAYAVFLVSPAVQSIWISMTSWNGITPVKTFVGFANYAQIFHDPTALLAMRNNVAWTVVTIAVPMVLGLLLAIALNGATLLKPFLRTIFYMPAVMPGVAIATIWAWLYDPSNGAINATLKAIGLGALAQPWLGQSSTAFAAIMVPAIWVRSGFPMLIYLAALQGIPDELYESAKTDGANPWQNFWHITMPSLRQAHYMVLALSLIDSFKVFDMVYAMTNGGPGNSTQVLGTWMYFNVFQFYHAGYGSALAVLITIIALACGIPYVLSQMRDEK
ncbi:MAG: sugar ABC transporter permease [Microbacteriaceae bacterium]|nr:sugar ABC transporter permease [Microbacteriaceae bacterium]